MFMSAIITSEYRHDTVQLHNKLVVKRMFVRYVSHEVRTPLNSCILGVEYLKTAIRTPTEACIAEMADILDEVSESCNTAIDFMNNLLLYEKIDTMELPVYLKREDLGAVCAQVCESFKMGARQLEINLHLDVHESLTTFDTGDSNQPRFTAFTEIDGPKVVIVLRNLMSNALKFTPKGGHVTLSITPIHIFNSLSLIFAGSGSGSSCGAHLLPSSPSETTHFRVILSDTGRGMSQEEQMQLFTKIVQFSPNEIQQGGGSGIGLFLSHQIMAGHNLAIQVHSEGIKGKGTQFFIDFPVLSTLSDDHDGDGGGRLFTESKSGHSLVATVLSCCKKHHSSVQDVELVKQTASHDICDREDDVLSTEGKPMLKSARSCMSLSSRRTTFRAKPLADMRVLIVDDSVLNRKMLRRTLKQHQIGASFEDASDGLELLALFGVPENDHCDDVVNFNSHVQPIVVPLRNMSAYDVILLDDNMIQMCGSIAVKKLRQHGYEGLVVGVTGSALEEDMKAFCEAGVDYALPKPFVVEDFMEIVLSHFQSL